MRSSFLSRSRRWIGASALAIVIGLGGGSAFLAATAPANAQLQTAANEIAVPSVSHGEGFGDLVEAVKPAVVSIIVESEDATRDFRRGGREFNFNMPDLPGDHPFRDFLDQFGDQFGQGEGQGQGNNNMQPRRTVAAGSGFVISADGYIVTNNHVVDHASKVTVVFDDGDEREATIVGTDERTDLAVVKIEGKEDLSYVKLSDADVRVGDWVVAVGNPFGLGGTVTAGIVSARGRDIAGSQYGDFLQIDAAINTGNSGGPAFNLDGDVVGVNTAIFSPNGANAGIAFAIPADVVKFVTTQLIENGNVSRGFLGVGIQDVTRDIAKSVALDTAKGAVVTEPQADGPAAKAGVQSGDIIVAVDGDQIDGALDLSRTISGKGPDATVELTLWRDGKEETLSVKLAALQEDAAAAEGTNQLQPEPEVIEPELAPSSIGITLVPNAGGEGLLIEDIDPTSAAADRGLAVGDAILEVNKIKVASAAEFEKAISEVRSGTGTALVKTQRNGNTRFIGLPVEEAN